MKAKPVRIVKGLIGYQPCEPSDATHVKLNFPGPYQVRILPVMIGGTRAGTPNWTWNGDVDKPTLKPSVLSGGGDDMPRCHSFVNDGKVQFLDDCSHELAGQTLDLLDVY
jgi:hypothetical protein